MKTDIVVRNIDFALGDEIPRYWFGGDPAKTHFMNALSTTFPEGEAFFVRSVLHYRDRIESPELRREIAAFAGQEGVHAREHAAHTDLLVRQGYGWLRKAAAMADRQARFANEKLPLLSLITTAATEHLTAILAHRTLEDPAYWREPMHEGIAELWQWHAIEEAEHKAVAFDVYRAVSGSYLLRCLAMVGAALGLWADNLVRFTYLVAKDGLLLRPSVWARMLWFVWGPRGLYSANARAFFAWFEPGFHPWQQDDRALIEARLSELQAGPKRVQPAPLGSPTPTPA